MSNYILSPNMSLPVPIVGVDPTPEWGTDLNSCLSLLDSHTHAPGYGALITPAGLNINANLSIGSNGLTNVAYTTYVVQTGTSGTVPAIGSVYVKSTDLYFNDLNGTQIQITGNGTLNIPVNYNLTGKLPTVSTLPIVVSAGNVGSNQDVIVRGAVASNGTKSQGYGFTSATSGTGIYTVTFVTSFTDTPSVFVQPVVAAGSVANVTAVSTASVTINCYAISGTTLANMAFSFFAVGERT